jgi:YD repeat-containing protein
VSLYREAEERLWSITGNGHSITYTYDANGQRVKKVEDGQTTVYLGNSYEKNVTANSVTTYYYASGQRVAQPRRAWSRALWATTWVPPA